MKKPDGWIALTSKGEICDVALSRQSIEQRMVGTSRDHYSTYESYIATLEACRNELLADGWQLKPVHLIDASPESPDLVINKEHFNKLIKWCHYVAEAHKRDLETLNCDDQLNEILENIFPEAKADEK